jgi:hypothetical protein
MELNVIVAIREAKGLTVCQKSILYSLASRGDQAYPNQKQLMSDSGIGSKNTLIKTIKQLQALGWIIVTKDKWQSNQYKNNRYKIQVPIMTEPGTNFDTNPSTKSSTLKINIDKDKQKINISSKNQGKAVLKHTSITSFLAEAPVSGVIKENNNG